jgi:cardiolipin synthase
MTNLKNVNSEAFKTSSYLVDTVGMPCFQNVNTKYYSFGEAYFKDMIIEMEKAERYIFLECYKIVPGKMWSELFDVLRLKARQGVHVKLVYDDAVCTQYISKLDYKKMQNHGIETVPFNKVKGFNSFVNYRNYKRLCVIDGKVGFFGGFDIDDEYVVNEEMVSATKDCGIKIMGEAVKNMVVMFFEDYQFATKKVINLQEYFADYPHFKTKDWILPYSTNPISQDNVNKNILASYVVDDLVEIRVIKRFAFMKCDLIAFTFLLAKALFDAVDFDLRISEGQSLKVHGYSDFFNKRCRSVSHRLKFS